ncbi:DUF2264 domain-containing protein [Confluentibacter sediminis]|uniref:DUF2264 domain-containing protein n=1 Tax=Confluentibacter sediminis TaxID=2219045 RepID=UPI000DADDD55|nr:DUF2264 domain-containing protein [Confluentibacter sediminis]
MRSSWVSSLEKIAFPVLNAAAADCLKETMPVYRGRNEFQYLEAVGRIVCGITPWLNLPSDETEEGKLRENYKNLTVNAIKNLVEPKANDYVDFGIGAQALVDAAYLAQGLLRAPVLWEALGTETQIKLLAEMKKTRQFKPAKNNWLLFASMIETFLLVYDNAFNKKRLYYGVDKFINDYYFGDGFYGDGASFSMDHYNSFVIHPMLIDILKYMNTHGLKKSNLYQAKQLPRYKRYVEIQERMISPEGAYPIFGRTLICRFGTFHALAQASLLQLLPANIPYAQVRCGLNAVLKRQMETLTNFDSQGFMKIGFNGKQNQMAEHYVSSGSPYHCSTIFLPLGLDDRHPFWANKDREWTSLKAFNGLEFNADHAYHEKNITKEFFMPFVYKFQSALFKIKRFLK